ncbi:MAG: energy-coupling factor transporter transmembrane component T [Syntrophomonadaceae bacterium]|nr:energy-coupling factor transporter transmembrane component T [Syntrophomonadaceae bacterium]
MWRDLTIGMYVAGDSVIHRLAASTKILVTALLMAAVFLVASWPAMAVLTVLLALAYRLTGLPWGLMLAGMRPLLFILAIALPLQVLLTAGEPWFYLGPLAVTGDALVQSGWLIFRLAALLFVTSLLTLTTSPVALADGLEGLLKPLERVKVPAHELAMIITIALRFIPLFSEEADKVSKAQKARGASLESGGLAQRLRSLVAILVPLLVGAFRRADELAVAMESRCYRGGQGRTRLHPETRDGRDWLALAVGLALFLLAVGERAGG